jgi:threonine/homoserine/homoserine lactone efflux protein
MEFLLLFTAFIIPFAWTPGPINVTLAAVGTASGFTKALPLILGINVAFLLQAIAMGMGLGKLFELYPLLYEIIRYTGAFYLLYLAYKMLTLRIGSREIRLNFWNGMLLSLLNPKVYMTHIIMYAQFVQEGQTLSGVLLLSLLATGFFFIGNSGWCLFGATLRRFMDNAVFFRIYKYFFALLLVGVAGYLVWG